MMSKMFTVLSMHQQLKGMTLSLVRNQVLFVLPPLPLQRTFPKLQPPSQSFLHPRSRLLPSNKVPLVQQPALERISPKPPNEVRVVIQRLSLV